MDMRLLKRILFLCFLLLWVSSAKGESPIEVKDYTRPLDFSGIGAVRIQKGDDPRYRMPDYPDDRWTAVSLPHNWNGLYPGWTGVCWYRFSFRFPPALPDTALGLSLGVISDVDEVYFNGELIGRSGEFGPPRKSSYDRKRIYEIPSRLIRPGAVNTVALRIGGLFAYENGPYRGDFRIAPFGGLLVRHLSREFLDLFFVAIYLFVALYFGVLFLRVSLDREYLFFSLFTLSSAVYLFLRTQVKYLLGLDFLLMKRIEYAVLFLILLFMMEYIIHYFRKNHGAVHYIYYGVTLFSLGVILLSRDVVLWSRVLFYLVEPSWLIPILYSLLVSLREFRRDSESKYILLSFPLVWLLFLNDVMVDRGVYDFVRISQFGLIAVIIGVAFIMRRRFRDLYIEVEDYRNRKNRTPITREAKEKLDAVLSYLDAHYRSDISREGLAQSVGLHHDYLGKLFRHYTGRKIVDYINEKRVDDAVRMLRETDRSVTDIAFEVGFESLSTFYRVFQKIMKESPTAFQEKDPRP